MGQDQLDKFIKSQIENHSTDIDTKALWNAITDKAESEFATEIADKIRHHESKIDSNKVWRAIQWKRYKGIRIASVALLSLALVTFFFLKQNNSNYTEYETSLESSHENIEITNSKKTPSQSKTQSSSLTQQNFTKTEDKASLNEASAVSEIETANRKNKKTSNSIAQNQSNYQKTTTGETKQNNVQFQTDTDAQVPSKAITENREIVPTDENIHLTGKKSSLIPAIGLPDKKWNADHIISSHSENKPTANIPSIDDCFRNSNSIKCYNHGPKKYHFSLLTYGTTDYYLKFMENSEAVSTYVADRKRTQAYRPSHRAGVHLKLRHKNGMYVKTGFEFGIIREKFSYEVKDTFTQILPDQLINIDINANGDTTRTYGNAPVTTIKQKTWRTNNKFETIGIPLIVGYQLENNKISYGLEMGVIYDFSHKFTGHLLDQSSDPTDARNYFNSNNKLNLTGGAHLTYRLNEKISTNLMVSFRQNLKSINDELYNVIDQKNSILGLGIGIEIGL